MDKHQPLNGSQYPHIVLCDVCSTWAENKIAITRRPPDSNDPGMNRPFCV